MDIDEWKKRAIQYFKSGIATEEDWETLAEALLLSSEIYGLEGGLDEAIENCGASHDQ